MMRVEELLLEIEDLIKNSWGLPLAKGKVVLEGDKVEDIIEEIRDNLPEELRQAKAIVADRNKILEDAKAEAESIINTAEEKARIILDKDEIVKQAKGKAEDILLEAKIQARDIRKSTNEYIDDIMKKTDDIMTNNLTELRKARQSLRNKQN